MHALGPIGVVFPVKNNWDRMINVVLGHFGVPNEKTDQKFRIYVMVNSKWQCSTVADVAG